MNMEGWNMSYNTTENPAGRRIAALLDAGSFAGDRRRDYREKYPISTCTKGISRRTASSPDTD